MNESWVRTRGFPLAGVVNDARWFPEAFHPQSGLVSFVETNRQTIADQVFLDGRWDRTLSRHGKVGLLELAQQLANRPPRDNLHFIWHTGFCCSTLLAKALNAPTRNLSLCEPQLLVEIARAKRDGAFRLHPVLAALPQVGFQLLGRGFEQGSAITIKASPAANGLISDAAALTAGKHLFLYSDCRNFLISLVKMGGDGFAYAREMFALLRREGHATADWSGELIRALSDLQIGALVWHMQIAEFRRSWDLFDPSRVRSLDCDAFLDAPRETLEAANEFLGLGLDAGHAAQAVSGPAFQRNAKQPEKAFHAGQRREEHAQVAAQLEGELDRTVAWSYNLFPQTPRGTPLAAPLVPTAKA